MGKTDINPLYLKIENRARELGYKDVTALCAASGASRGALSDLKCGRTKDLSMKTISKIAPLLSVGVDFFSIAEQPETEDKKAPALTKKDERDIARDLERFMDDLASSGDLMFDGVPMSAEARAAMSAAMRIGLEEAKRRNKETYTPKKYRKE